MAEHVADAIGAGNVNRNMIGAVVGVQPLGGSGLSAPDRKLVGRTIFCASPAAALR